MKADLSRYVDLQFLAVNTLVRNKDKLVKLIRGLSDDAMAFFRRSGIYFGLGIGLVQMVAWALFKNPWIMPAFGFAVGFISDYIALNMLFRPVQPTKYLGFIPFQGLLHAQRDKITRDYAKILRPTRWRSRIPLLHRLCPQGLAQTGQAQGELVDLRAQRGHERHSLWPGAP